MNTTSRKYDPHADSRLRSSHLASLLYILGVERRAFDDITIDDVIKLIRDKYVYSHDISMNIAAREYVKKQNIVLSRSVRRAWFDVQVANYEVENDR